MSSVIDRIKKRAYYPVKLVNGETVHVKALTRGEMTTASGFKDDPESVGYAIGIALLDDAGSPVFSIMQDETPKQFGARIMREVDFPPDIEDPLIDTIFKLSRQPSEKASEAIVKN